VPPVQTHFAMRRTSDGHLHRVEAEIGRVDCKDRKRRRKEQ